MNRTGKDGKRFLRESDDAAYRLPSLGFRRSIYAIVSARTIARKEHYAFIRKTCVVSGESEYLFFFFF